MTETRTKRVNRLAQRVRRQHALAMEVAIKRYQLELWQTVRRFEPDLMKAHGTSGYHKLVTTHLIANLNRAGEHHLKAAADVGFERALQDLYVRRWLVRYSSPVHAPHALVQQCISENRHYLERSLLPDVHIILDGLSGPGDVPAALVKLHSRIDLYGHYLWKTAERAYKLGLQMYDRSLHRA